MYNSFDLVSKLYFVRTSGSKEELKAAKIIQKECARFGVKAKLESFPVDAFEVEKAELHFSEPDIDVPFTAVGMSGSTPDKGVEGELVYITSPADAEINEIKDKICIIAAKMVDNKTYKILARKKPAALILCTGDVYLDEGEVDLDPYKYRKRHQDLAYIPAVCIRMKDAEKLVEHLPKKAHITLKQKMFKTDSHNVVAEIKGTEKAEEVIVYSAHYDSVSYSKGAYDNATGSACILEMLGYYSEHRPKRTVRFLWCGSEEEGLLGSRFYVEKHKKQLEKIVLNINIDMLGVTLGKDIACVSANEDLVHYLQYLSKMEGFPLEVRQGVYSSDSTPFADAGIPALSFARMSVKGGASIHSRKDVIDHLSPENYYRSCGFIEKFSDSLIDSVCFPVPREIPDKVKEDLDYYNLRKERK